MSTTTMKRLAAVSARKRKAEQEFLRAVLDAVDQGMSYRAVADVTGMSKSRIHQIATSKETP